MDLVFKIVCGFKFVKIGRFKLHEVPPTVRFAGKQDQINVAIELFYDLFRQADESAYVIFADETLVYVGEYSYNFQDRWLRKGNSVWHNTDIKIEEKLRNNSEVTIWLVVDPCVLLPDGMTKINISKSIEQEILKTDLPEWNKRGQYKKWHEWRTNNCVHVTEIIRQISRMRLETSSLLEVSEAGAERERSTSGDSGLR